MVTLASLEFFGRLPAADFLMLHRSRVKGKKGPWGLWFIAATCRAVVDRVAVARH